jgi:hypothetical protein
MTFWLIYVTIEDPGRVAGYNLYNRNFASAITRFKKSPSNRRVPT